MTLVDFCIGEVEHGTIYPGGFTYVCDIVLRFWPEWRKQCRDIAIVVCLTYVRATHCKGTGLLLGVYNGS